MITVTADLSGLNAKILKLANIAGDTVGAEMRTASKGLAVQLSRYTQPFGFDSKAREQGEHTIARDIERGFYILPDALCQNPTPINEGQYAGWLRLFATKTGIVWIVQAKNFRVGDSTQTLYRHHQELRNHNGVIPRDRNLVDKQDKIAAIQVWVISQSQYNAYLPFLQKEVGFAKAGWAECAKQLGNVKIPDKARKGIGKYTAQGGTRGIPGWVTRHLKGNSIGQVIANLESDRPTLTMINKINYTDRVLSSSNQKGAVRDAEYRLQKRIDAALKYGVKGVK